jgi:hypothetical protein
MNSIYKLNIKGAFKLWHAIVIKSSLSLASMERQNK